MFLLAGFAVIAITGLLLILDRQLARHAGQVADLCQRLQAPETAVAAHLAASVSTGDAYLPFDDDAAYVAYQNGRSQ